MIRFSKFPARAAACLAVSLVAGCASGSLASDGAASGARSGALGGAVAGAIGSVFWGGNVLGNMAASAAVGAASGAAIGAAAGASADQEIEQRRERSEADATLASRIGSANYEAATALAMCKHKKAIGKARTAYGVEQSPERKRFALFIEAIANEEMGEPAAAQKVYPLLASTDPAGGTVEMARSEALSGILEVQRVRQEHGLKPIC